MCNGIVAATPKKLSHINQLINMESLPWNLTRFSHTHSLPAITPCMNINGFTTASAVDFSRPRFFGRGFANFLNISHSSLRKRRRTLNLPWYYMHRNRCRIEYKTSAQFNSISLSHLQLIYMGTCQSIFRHRDTHLFHFSPYFMQ